MIIFALMKKNFSDILCELDRVQDSAVKEKLPHWAGAASLEFPSKLSLEQCSGSDAALHKAGLVSGRVADLTGGLGADSWAFAKNGCTVDYFEMKPELAAAAQRNFEELGVSERITVHCSRTDAASVSALGNYDCIYLDPARRDSAGKKVFLLEDCSPNVLELIPLLWEHCSRIMVKLSPMADISMLARRLGDGLREIQIVSLRGEVKELLCLLEKGCADEPVIRVVDCRSGEDFSFTASEEASAAAVYVSGQFCGRRLFVPGAALMKSGAFKLLSQRCSLEKFAPSTHLYLGSGSILNDLGKWYDILEVLPFGKTSFSSIAERFPDADVTARNIPMTSAQLKERIHSSKKAPGSCAGDHIHVFAFSSLEDRLILICRHASGNS